MALSSLLKPDACPPPTAPPSPGCPARHGSLGDGRCEEQGQVRRPALGTGRRDPVLFRSPCWDSEGRPGPMGTKLETPSLSRGPISHFLFPTVYVFRVQMSRRLVQLLISL